MRFRIKGEDRQAGAQGVSTPFDIEMDLTVDARHLVQEAAIKLRTEAGREHVLIRDVSRVA